MVNWKRRGARGNYGNCSSANRVLPRYLVDWNPRCDPELFHDNSAAYCTKQDSITGSRLMNVGTKTISNRRRKLRSEYLVFGQPLIEEAEIEEVVKSLRAAWLGTGPKVAKFEKLVAEYKRVPYAVAVNSCTAGLHLGCMALGIGRGDEVIAPAMIFC